MTAFQATAEIILCFFAILGVYFLVTKIIDGAVAKNAPSENFIYIDWCDKDDLEYLVRFFESRVVHGDLDGLVNGIIIGSKVGVDAAEFDKLSKEFDNIRKK